MNKFHFGLKFPAIAFIVYLFINLNCQAQNNNKKIYIINGAINGVDSGVIKMFSDDRRIVVDSAIIKNGKFTLSGSMELPEQRLFQITPGIWSFLAFAEPGRLKFTIDTANAQHSGIMGHGGHALIWTINEEGSNLSDVYNKYMNETKLKYYASMLSSLSASLDTSKNNDTKKNIAVKIDSIVNTAYNTQRCWVEKYISQHPSSPASAFLLADYYTQKRDLSLDYLRSMLAKLSGDARRSVYYTQLTAAAHNMENRKKDATAPDFSLLTRDKTAFTLSSLRGKFVLLDFWASWCGPCRTAIPALKNAYAKYHSKGFEIVSISDDTNKRDWENAIIKEGMTWIQVMDFNSSANADDQHPIVNRYAIKGLPSYVLLDKSGKVILTSQDKDKIVKEIDKLFK